jgi:hypothetical protein
MDLEKISSDGKASLLALPRSDFDATPSTALEDTVSTCTESSEPLVLLQLPAGWSVKDLRGAHFVAKKHQHAALVCDSRKASFSVSNVETSNCLILVPPLQEKRTGGIDDDFSNIPTKKLKLSFETDTLRTVPARLLKAQGASFLDLHPSALRMADLKRALSQSVFDPYNSSNSNTGWAVQDLAHYLQQPIYAVERGLERLEGVFAFDSQHFVLLSEETLAIVHHAMISTLAEVDDFHDYARAGVDVNRFVEQTFDCMSDEERFDIVHEVIRHCLYRLAATSPSLPGGRLKLCVTKVCCRRIVCHKDRRLVTF